MKMAALLELHAGVRALSTKELPVRLAYRVSKTLTRLRAEVAEHDKQKLALVQKYGERVGNGWQVKPENLIAFGAEYQELLGVETDYRPELLIADTELEALETGGLKLRPEDLARLAPVIGDT